ncbi:MliC family protein [Gelidibacter pelagius]|nr:MliC family protein [Gelidibacter pelagius]
MTMLTALFLSSCKESPKQENTETTSTEQVADDIVTSTSTDADGNNLEMAFNNTKGTATVNFKGETIELVAEKSASGIWYINDDYELRGKGNDIELKKDGKVIFTYNDAIITTSLKNKEGQTLDMTVNNTTNTAKVYLDGGEQIELEGQNPASGIWYKNDHYELRGKGNDIELKKDGKLVFKHDDDIVKTSLKNEKGQTLDMTFNNTTNEVKVYLDGGEQIDLVGERAASGIWYKNDHYELRGKGNNLELKKDGEIVFKS